MVESIFPANLGVPFDTPIPYDDHLLFERSRKDLFKFTEVLSWHEKKNNWHFEAKGFVYILCHLEPLKLCTSFFQVTFWSPKWRSLSPWKGHLKHPKGSLGRNRQRKMGHKIVFFYWWTITSPHPKGGVSFEECWFFGLRGWGGIMFHRSLRSLESNVSACWSAFHTNLWSLQPQSFKYVEPEIIILFQNGAGLLSKTGGHLNRWAIP